jgi:hypothetical protein
MALAASAARNFIIFGKTFNSDAYVHDSTRFGDESFDR